MRRTTALLLVTLAGVALLAATAGSAAATDAPTTASLDAPADADAQWCYDLPCPCIVCVEPAGAMAEPPGAVDVGLDCIDPDCCPEDVPCEGVEARTVG